MPARVVDGTGIEWRRQPAGWARTVYLSADRRRRTLAEVRRDHPHVRPVTPPNNESAAALLVAVRDLLAQPQRRHQLTATLCVALADVAGVDGRLFPLVLDRQPTPENTAVTTMAHLLGPHLARDPWSHDHDTRDTFVTVITGWITGPDCYTEPATALADLLAAPVLCAGGWPAVTDDDIRCTPHGELLAWYLTSRGLPRSNPPYQYTLPPRPEVTT